jgi:2-succinyl-5-enolpyruvyl-6-hydroxy-3-cyclohexene-1-carboxylate synthase
VHLNFPFREPLIPAMRDVPHSGDAPASRVTTALRRASRESLAALAAELHAIPRGIIVCGPQDDDALPAAVAVLGRALGYPVLADPLSGVRCGEHDRSLIVSAYDAFLRDADLAAALLPDAVLRFGAQPTSKPLVQMLRACAGAREIVVDAEDGWTEPLPPGTEIVRADPTSFCDDLASAAGNAQSDWARTWMSCETSARAAIGSHFDGHAEISEPAVIADLASVLPDGATVFAGNSMPVRDLDSLFPAIERRIRFLANRGVNGIDGVVSSALGASTAAAPLVLVIGDLSFYHDMNGLLAAKQHGVSATIVLVNNDGGGIFSFLPQAQHPERFEALFGTPHGLDFSAAAAVYGLEFVRAATRAEFRAAVARSIASPGVQIIEVRTDRAENVGVHREIWRRVAAERAR